MKRLSKRRLFGAFTIVEMLISAALILILIGVVYNLYVLAKDTWLNVYEHGRMQSKALFIMEGMVSGVDAGRKGIYEAQDVIIPAAGNSDTQIEFVDQDDPSVTRSFYLSGDREVRYIDEAGTDSYLDIDEDVDNDVEALTFTRPSDNDDLIIIGLALKKTVMGKHVSVNLSTSVKLRNM